MCLSSGPALPESGGAEIDPKLRVVVVTKDQLELSNSAWAQGGIAGVLDPSDTVNNHVEDTLTAGAGLCDRKVVESICPFGT